MRGNVLIAGLGLIGGSIALAIKRVHPDATMIGYDVSGESLRLARSLGVIDEAVPSFAHAACEADVIVLAAPVAQTEQLLRELVALPLRPDVIVTDVGSTKERIVKQAWPLLEQGVTFIGGHPMAGSHKSGVAAARAHLFENAFYILTPTEHVKEEQITRLKRWLEGTKAHFVTLTPKEHDRIAGVISHFPHIIAASLVHQAQQYEREDELVSRLAAGGFRDITRIASSNPEMWRDIFIHNKEELLHLFDRWIEEMKKFVRTLRTVIANGFINTFVRRNSFVMGCLSERKERFLPFTIYMLMCQTIRGLFLKLPVIWQKSVLALQTFASLKREKIFTVCFV
ncbi:prephenate dehydrogenase [Anoxybacillus sp. BCO1]|nr:prephenate dehydrogenase [Anoxybacillus sp. BCO1]